MRLTIAFLLFLSAILMGQNVVVAPDVLAPTLINGTPVAPGTWTQVVRIRSGESVCTASLVGKRVLLTAAHCVEEGQESSFSYHDVVYKGVGHRSKLYPNKDHDLAVIILDQEVPLDPLSIGGVARVGKEVTILGYGCTKPGGGGGNDGILRIGTSQIRGYSNYDVVSSNKPKGAALCYGDSGGPLLIAVNKKGLMLLGVNSKGNIKDTNYNTRLDLSTSKSFLLDMATTYSAPICGINLDCGMGMPKEAHFTTENRAVRMETWSKGMHSLDYLQRHVKNLADFLNE